MQVSKIFLSNRTELKAKEVQKLFPEIETVKWGTIVDFDIIIFFEVNVNVFRWK